MARYCGLVGWMSLFTSTVAPLGGWPPGGLMERDPPYVSYLWERAMPVNGLHSGSASFASMARSYRSGEVRLLLWDRAMPVKWGCAKVWLCSRAWLAPTGAVKSACFVGTGHAREEGLH